MNKHLLAAVCATTIMAAGTISVPVMAGEHDTVKEKTHSGKKMKRERPKNRQEAIAKTKKRLEKLESMTDEEWEEARKKGKERWKKRQERKKKMMELSPEERQELKEKFKEMREQE